MPKKTDLDKTIKVVHDLISEKKKEIIKKRIDLKAYEEELATLVSVEAELVKVNKAFEKALRNATHGGKELREALLSSMVPPGQQPR
jgi:hypothetical protein